MRAPEFNFEARTLARRDDPATSKAGAADVLSRLGELQAFALRCVVQWPDHTACELSQLAKIADPRRINRRLGELRRLGLIVESGARECTVTGRSANTWRAA